jgi:multidrug efflux system membrane fusion protein
VSQAELDKLAAEAAASDAAVKAAKANVETAALNLKFTEVNSPVDGIAGRHLLTIGNLVIQDNTLLTTIVSVDPMYAYFDVDERTMLRVQKLIREGKVVSLRDAEKDKSKIAMQYGLANEGDDYPHEGVLDFVNNQVDSSTGTIQVRGILANPKHGSGDTRLLTPGLFVRVRLPIGKPHQALLVPQAALGTDQGVKFLYVVNDKNTVEYRPVALGPEQADSLQVVEPIQIVRTKEGLRPAQAGEQGQDSLTPSDRIIVGGLQRVRSGMIVEPKSAAETGK